MSTQRSLHTLYRDDDSRLYDQMDPEARVLLDERLLELTGSPTVQEDLYRLEMDRIRHIRDMPDERPNH